MRISVKIAPLLTISIYIILVLQVLSYNDTETIIAVVKDNGCGTHIELDTTPKTNRSEYRYENL